jgi:3-phenylpropionate/cinnamic acid dioxygenase small subunit
MTVTERPSTTPVALEAPPSPTAAFDPAMYARISQFYAVAAQSINDARLADWVDLFVERAKYSMISRANYERGLPLATMFYESKGALLDRVTAVDNTMVYQPRAISLVIGSIALIGTGECIVRARSSFSMYQTYTDGDPHLFMAGRTFDEIENVDGTLHFAKRVIVFDSERIAGSLVYPI